jgi:SAM-dependent methyltransferase
VGCYQRYCCLARALDLKFYFHQSLARLGAKTLGVDASEANISIAKLHAAQDPKLAQPGPSTSLSYLHTPAEVLLKEAKRYDVVCSMEVLEHVDNPPAFLDTCAKLLKVRAPSIGRNILLIAAVDSRAATYFSPPSRVQHSRIFSPFLWRKTFCAKFRGGHTPTPSSFDLTS